MRLSRFMLAASVVALLAGCSRTPTQSISQVSAPNTTNKTALRIYHVLPVYAQAAKLPWQPIRMDLPLAQGHRDNHIPIIRERLVALHYLPANDNVKSDLYDSMLSQAIAQFQSCNGLKSTGALNQDTLNALNITPAARYQQLVDAMHEWEKYPEEASSRYVQVNIPSYEMHLIDKGENALSMRVIVGRDTRPTPTLSSKITTIVFNPTWTVPETILSKDVIPGMQKDPNYMKQHYDMRVYQSYKKDAPEINPTTINWQNMSGKNFPYRITAPASDTNPLGRVKFIFENDQDVYMHDTPDKALFDLTNRARSSGCIRLQDPMALVRYFGSDNQDLTPELVAQYLSTYQTKYIQLRTPMPVYITYITAWVDANDHAHFAMDVYDKRQAQMWANND